VYRSGTSTEDQTEDSALLQVYVKMGARTKECYLDTALRVDFTDTTTGERRTITMQGEWRSRNAMFWLEQGNSTPRMALGRVFRPKSALLLLDAFTLEIAPNVDTALVLLVIAIVDDDLKRARLVVNKTESTAIMFMG
ncbi:hypothetical protein Gpo141_00011030, partial [Globisporangium polare]